MKDKEVIKGAASMAQRFSLAFARLEPSKIAGVPPQVHPATLTPVMLKILKTSKINTAQCELKEAFLANKHRAYSSEKHFDSLIMIHKDMLDNIFTSTLKTYCGCPVYWWPPCGSPSQR